ncbi:hypothetical protein D1872_291180 [compost metagenome]
MAEYDIQELRQLINGIFADKPPHSCHARIVLYFKYRAVRLVLRSQFHLQLLRVLHHGSELIHIERSPVFTDPPLFDHYGSFAVQLDAYGYDEQ